MKKNSNMKVTRSSKNIQ